MGERCTNERVRPSFHREGRPSFCVKRTIYSKYYILKLSVQSSLRKPLLNSYQKETEIQSALLFKRLGIYRAIEIRIGFANTIQSYRLQNTKRHAKYCVSLSRSINDSFIQSPIKTRIYKRLIPGRSKSSRIKKHYRQRAEGNR